MNTSNFFQAVYTNAEVNAMLIMDMQGIVIDVNPSFTSNFGYSTEEIKGRSFKILYIDSDREKRMPEKELAEVQERGQANDENYVVDKEGRALWCTGEALKAEDAEGNNFIVKIIINLQAKKQVQLFLNDTEDLLEHVFLSSKEMPMMVLDGSLKIQKVNDAFMSYFNISDAPAETSRLAELSHPFWRDESVRNELRKVLVSNGSLKNMQFSFEEAGGRKQFSMSAKIIERKSGMGRNLFVIIDPL